MTTISGGEPVSTCIGTLAGVSGPFVAVVYLSRQAQLAEMSENQ